MFTSRDLKAIITEARPIVERQLDDAALIAGFRTKVTEKGGDWSQVKALVKAMIQDERDDAGGHKRVLAILSKAGNALGYADMLGLGNLNEKNSFEPEHDAETGEVTNYATTKGGDDESRSAAEPAVTYPGRRRHADSGNGPDEAAAKTGELQRHVQPETNHEPAEGSAEEISASHFISAFTIGHTEPEAAMLPQTVAVDAAVDQGAADLVPSDPLRSDAANGNEAGAAAPDHSKPNPICRDPGDCGVYASWAMPCQTCKRAARLAA